jgi:hypothetical protein
LQDLKRQVQASLNMARPFALRSMIAGFIALFGALNLASPAFAWESLSSRMDQAPSWSSQPYGSTPGDYQTPYSAPQRDQYNNRLVVNGRVVDLGDSNHPSPSSRAAFSSGVSAGSGMLRGPSLTAMSVGNSIELTAVSNSTIFITQHNNGRQDARIGAAQ